MQSLGVCAVCLVFVVLLQTPGCVSVVRDCKIVMKTFKAPIMQLSTLSESDVLYKNQSVVSNVVCASRCVSDLNCLAFFVMPNTAIATPSSRNGFQCWLLTDRLPDSQLIHGNGTYGYLYTVTTAPTPPEPVAITSGVFEKIGRTKYGLAAIYSCTGALSSMTDIALLTYGDFYGGQWQILSPQCLSSLCSQLGLSGTLLNVTHGDISGTFRVRPVCREHENYYGDADCDATGQWTFSQPTLNVGCVPTDCVRINSIGKGVYKGTKFTSDLGVTCQLWDADTPTVHYQTPSLFLEDDYDRTAAMNYCRDPDKEGKPWCYQTVFQGSDNWRFCAVPKCVTGIL